MSGPFPASDERYAADANRKNSIHIGIAERIFVTKAGGFQGMPGDYIHFNQNVTLRRRWMGDRAACSRRKCRI